MLEELSREDQAALELLRKARERRQIDILEAARRGRAEDDHNERSSSYAGLLAQEAISLHDTLIRLNRRVSVPKLLGRSGVKVARGEVTHSPKSHFGNNRYPIETPLMLATPQEIIGDSAVIDGYKFSTTHPQRHHRGNPTIVISHLLQDKFTGIDKTTAYEYIIHTYGQESGHPYATIWGAGAGARLGEITDYNDPRYEEPIGLLRLANQELSNRGRR